MSPDQNLFQTLSNASLFTVVQNGRSTVARVFVKAVWRRYSIVCLRVLECIRIEWFFNMQDYGHAIASCYRLLYYLKIDSSYPFLRDSVEQTHTFLLKIDFYQTFAKWKVCIVHKGYIFFRAEDGCRLIFSTGSVKVKD